MSDTARRTGEAPVAIEIPASSRHMALVRTTAVGVIAERDPDLDVVENLRLAVNELVSLVLESADGGSVRVEFHLEPSSLLVIARPSEPGEAVAVDELARRILGTTAMHHEFRDDGSGELRIDLTGTDTSG